MDICKAIKIGTTTLKRHQNILCCGLIGALVFVAVYGLLTLDVTYDHWILNGYAEADIIQHYAGWMAYRQSAWHWPLGMMEGLGGGAITFTDSIPWVSIFFKLIRCVLPETFQFFGLYIFACLVIQGIAAGKILSLLTENRTIIAGGTLLFCVSPILLERAFRHTALASHWLILFAIYLLLQSRKTKIISWKYVLLSVLAIGIHPYFLPMIYAVFAVNAVEVIVDSRAQVKRVSFVFMVSVVVTILAGYCIGAFGTGRLSGGGGFGYYSMNINALINPISCGGFIWSKTLPSLPQILGNYDGFNYLGLGCIIAIPAAVIYIAIYHREVIKRNIILIVVCIALTMFALSNVITYNDQVICEYQLPLWIMQIAAIFRASSRMFYPVYYCLLVLVIWCISKCGWRKDYLICVLLIVQLWDLSPVLDIKYQDFKKETVEAKFAENVFYNTSAWNDIAQNFESIKMLNNQWDYSLAAFGGKCGKVPDISISRAPTVDLGAIYERNIQELIENDADPEAVYLLSDKSFGVKLAGLLSPSYTMYDCGTYIAITATAERIEAETVLPLMTADISDHNWQYGVWVHGDRILLFSYDKLLENALRPGRTIATETSSAQIEAVQVFGDQWIHVRIADNDVPLEDFQYPAPLLLD